LDDGDWMHGMGATNSLGSGLAQTQRANLALLNQPGHRADRIFHRHRRIDAVLVVEIDDLDS